MAIRLDDLTARMNQQSNNAPVVSVQGSETNRKKSQYWVNFGVVMDASRCTRDDATGFAELFSVPLDNLEDLKAKRMKGPKVVRQVINAGFGMLKDCIGDLEPGEHQFIALGDFPVESMPGLQFGLHFLRLSDKKDEPALKCKYTKLA